MLKEWIKEKGYFQKNEMCDKFTHLLLDGGKVFLPRNKEREFFNLYAEDMKNNRKLYYVEARPNVFKFMIDIDIKDDRYWELSYVIELAKVVQKTISLFYKKSHVMLCCTSPAKRKGEYIHTGIHFIWPELFVNSKNAMILRDANIHRIKETNLFAILTKHSDLTDVFDDRIYKSNGYRMVGSDKYNRETRSPEERELVLSFVMNPDLTLNEVYKDRLLNHLPSLIAESSIRYIPDKYHASDSNGMKFDMIPPWVKPSEKKKETEIVGTKDYVLMQYFINKIPEYTDIKINKVSRYSDSNILATTSSKYCMNIAGNHKSCGIYFFATPSGIFQKCLCPCENLKGRINGYCRNYTSKCYPFDEETKKQLFPNVNFFEESSNPIKITKKDMIKKRKNDCDKLLHDIMNS